MQSAFSTSSSYLAAMPPRRKKKGVKAAKTAIRMVVLTAIIGMGYIGFLWWQNSRLRMVRYKEFGIPVPTIYPIHGIDVSRYQQRISWEAVKEMKVEGIQIGFAFIKATEGVESVDPYFKRNWKASRDAGIVRGAYHFFIPIRSGQLQAENFFAQVQLEPGDLPPVLDVEQASGTAPEALRKEIQSWLNAVSQHYSMVPVIYTNISFYNSYLAGYFDEYPLWIAHYLQLLQPTIARDWTFWQHSEAGHVNGILSRVDFNVFNGDSIRFRALLKE